MTMKLATGLIGAVILFTITASGAQYTVNVSASPTNGGTVNGNGTFGAGTSQTVSATPFTGWRFLEWMEGQTIVSLTNSYEFTLVANRTLVAHFATNNQFGSTVSIDPDSTKGNFHGSLHLSFDTNAYTYLPDMPPLGNWNSGPGFSATFTNESSRDVATINLPFLSEEPGEEYLYGSMQVTINELGASSYLIGPIGGGGGIFRPGSPYSGFTDGGGQSISQFQGMNSMVVISNSVGFSLSIPWDGTSCNSTGVWWIRYKETFPIPTNWIVATTKEGNLLLTVSGQSAIYKMEVSSNLVNWSSAFAFTNPASGSITFTNPFNAGQQILFYRVAYYP